MNEMFILLSVQVKVFFILLHIMFFAVTSDLLLPSMDLFNCNNHFSSNHAVRLSLAIHPKIAGFYAPPAIQEDMKSTPMDDR